MSISIWDENEITVFSSKMVQWDTTEFIGAHYLPSFISTARHSCPSTAKHAIPAFLCCRNNRKKKRNPKCTYQPFDCLLSRRSIDKNGQHRQLARTVLPARCTSSSGCTLECRALHVVGPFLAAPSPLKRKTTVMAEINFLSRRIFKIRRREVPDASRVTCCTMWCAS